MKIHIKKDWRPLEPERLSSFGPALNRVAGATDWSALQSSIPGPGTLALRRMSMQLTFDHEARLRRFNAWKASLWISATTTPLRFAEARALIDGGYPCSSGVSARWCANCGECTCPRDEDGSRVTRERHTSCGSSVLTFTEVVHDKDCPLHSPESPHAGGEVE